MTLEVLQNKSQITNARRVMKKRGISFIGSRITAFGRRLRLTNRLALGDELKSWDVLRTIEFLEQNLASNADILDIGCFCSEILPCLHDLGFTRLTGNDLNPDTIRMPYAEDIDYRQENFLHSSLPDASFDAITSISVLEHGFDGPAFLGEMSRLLRPGGVLLSSFDYWPEKIDTGKTTFFGMSWTLFSQHEIEQLIDLAAEHKLELVGTVAPTATDRPIHCSGYRYTFGWLALRKRGV